MLDGRDEAHDYGRLDLSPFRRHTGTMPLPHPNDPLHGITLETILTELVARHGWEKMGRAIDIRCFTSNPSIKSSLTFLRKTPWARKKVEDWFLSER